MPSTISPFIILGSILLLQTLFNIILIYWVDRLNNKVDRLETRQVSTWLQEVLNRIERLEKKRL